MGLVTSNFVATKFSRPNEDLIPTESVHLSYRSRFAPCDILKVFKSHTEATQVACSPTKKKKLRCRGFFFLVPEVGLEPTSLAAHDFESCAYANSATPAMCLV